MSIPSPWNSAPPGHIASLGATGLGASMSLAGILMGALNAHAPRLALFASEPSPVVLLVVQGLTSTGFATVFFGFLGMIVSNVFADRKHRREHDCSGKIDALTGRMDAQTARAERAERLLDRLSDHADENSRAIREVAASAGLPGVRTPPPIGADPPPPPAPAG